MKRPSRKKLAEEVAEILTEEIRSKRWEKKLPGYRSLCELLGVSRRTIDGAFDILTHNGLLLPSQGRVGRQIASDVISAERSTKRKKIRILAREEHEALAFNSRTILWKFEHQLGDGWDIEHRKSNAFSLKHPGKTMSELFERNPGCRWILVAPTYAIAKWAEHREEDIICLGGEIRGTSVRCLTVFYADLAKAQLETLLALGHRRICIPFCEGSPTGGQHFVASIAEVFEANGIPFSQSYNAPSVPDNREALWQTLERLFQFTPPTAIIALSFEWFLTMSSFCQQNQIRVPKNLSLTLCGSTPLVDWLKPRPPTVEFPISRFVSTLKRWAIRGRSAINPGTTSMKPKAVSGTSIAPPCQQGP